MKTILLFALILVMPGTGTSIGQNLKFGHINSTELIQSLQEFSTAQAELERLRKDLIDHLQTMNAELSSKYNEYQKNSRTYTDIVKQVKEQELQDMDRRIQEFQSGAQTNLEQKQAELFQPIYEKAEKAIKEVGKENGFLYIFDVTQSNLMYFDKSVSTDVLNLVKAKLKVK